MGMGRADQDGFRWNVGARGDLLRDRIANPDSQREHLDAHDRGFAGSVGNHECARGEVVMDTGRVPSAAAVTGHRDPDRRIEFHSRSARVKVS